MSPVEAGCTTDCDTDGELRVTVELGAASILGDTFLNLNFLNR